MDARMTQCFGRPQNIRPVCKSAHYIELRKLAGQARWGAVQFNFADCPPSLPFGKLVTGIVLGGQVH